MKTLLKISCVLAIALFVSMSVKAVEPVGGTITTEVVEFLDFGTFDAGGTLTYDEFGTTDDMDFSNTVAIRGNVDWTLSLAADAAQFTGPKELLVSKVSVTGMGTEFDLSTTAHSINGLYTEKSKEITFTLDNLLNQYAGTYTVDITYTLAKKL